MAVSTKVSKSGVCLLLGLLGVAGAQTVACSSKFSSCYAHRNCPAEPNDEAGAAGEESSGAGGGAGPSAGASGSGRDGVGGVSATSGTAGTDDAGGSNEAVQGGTSGGTSAAGTANDNGGTANGGTGTGGSAAAPSGCNACANGFACSTTTCKSTCSADTDCLDDHFCSGGQCRLDAVQVSIGHSHACMLLADKTVSCWGKNDQSQLGTASSSASATPVQVKFLSDVQSIAAGDGITFALLNDGTGVFWGSRYTAFNLGTGLFISTSSQYPTPLEGLSTVKQIATGGRSNACATLADGSARCWGINDWGQLGNGTHDFSVDPVVVSGVNGATGIAFGYSFACAHTPSAVQCWGDNVYGQLGSYPNSVANTPQTITGLSGTVSKLRTGDDFGCVLTTTGSVQCWGNNSSGQLGDSTSGPKETPVTVSAIPGVSDLATAISHTCALLAGGTVRCWGDNSAGQIGNGNTTSPVTTPTTVQGISGAIAVAAGGRTTCATLSNGSVKCWGRIVGTDSTNYADPTTVW